MLFHQETRSADHRSYHQRSIERGAVPTQVKQVQVACIVIFVFILTALRTTTVTALLPSGEIWVPAVVTIFIRSEATMGRFVCAPSKPGATIK